ncbi:MFS transporter [Amycolatopsis suaedae]|uniref:MFS transporter n=1 Tax=Amycolatopsis suaedae TaxID=2510978 RepID=A0A4Q7J5Z9_9PSEU|nr:MFS transporter [Amycolatopsis suaedae]RZQ61723.1 MFS transporter [Amycolatopsis suaedae]
MTDIAPKAGRREWLGLAVLVLATVLVAMDLSVLFYAVPFITAALDPSSTQLLWIMDVYGFLLAGLLITMGSLGDRIGRRRLLLFGAAAFGVSSAIAAYSTSPEMLIAARALLGIAGATLAPSTLSLIRNMFLDERQRRTAIGVWTGGFGGGAIIGPLVSGLLLDHFWWGMVFLINVPVMVALLVLAPLLVPEFKDPNPGRFDLLSAAMSLAAVLPVIYGVKELAAADAQPWLPLASLVFGLAVGVAFVRRQRSLDHPMIDMRLFGNRRFATAISTTTTVQFTMTGMSLFLSQYLQLVLGYRPFTAALWMLPAFAGMFLGLSAGTVLARKLRPASTMGFGLTTAAAGLAVLALVADTRELALLVLGGGLMAAGIGMVSVVSTDMVLASAPPERAGVASALSETSTEFGGALGIAVLGTIGAAVYRDGVEVPPGLPAEAAAAVKDTLAGAAAVAGQLGDAGLLAGAQAAFTSGVQVTMAIGAVCCLVAAALAVTMLRSVALPEPPESGVEVDRHLV